jgi:hypothetical protein
MSSREASASASETPNVAIFNIKREKVTQVVPYTADLEKSLLEVLQSSPTMFGGFSLNPRNGLVLRFIFSTPIQPEHRLYPNRIKELYLFLEPLAKPKALLFLTSDRPKTMVVEFNYDTELFVRRHQLEREWLLSH